MTTFSSPRIERQRYLVDFAVSTFRRHKSKTFGVWVIYTMTVFILASVILFGGAVRREAADLLEGAPDLIAQGMRMGRHELTYQADIAKLKSLRGADRIEGRLWGYLYDTAAGANYTLQVPSPRDTEFVLDAGETIVGEGVARARGLAPGKFLFLVSPSGRFLKARVKSLLGTGSALATSDLVLLSEPDFRAFFELPADVFTDVAMRVRNPSEVDTIARKAALALPAYRFITKSNMQRTYEAVFSWREGMVLATLVGALLAFAILAFDKASGLSAHERREIGILKAIGWDTRDIMAMKLWEGGLVSGTAFALGFIMAYVHVFVFAAPLLEQVLKGWSTLYPRFSLSPTIDFLQIATVGFLTIVPYIGAIVVPVWRTASADPDWVMR